MKTDTALTFHDLPLSSKIVDFLDRSNFVTPTPIQHKVIPLALENKDIVGVAQTGTGKTMAFGLPLIQKLSQQNGNGLILVPTRELALQMEEVLAPIVKIFGFKTVVIIGGTSMSMQIKALRRQPRILIATPGRLIDHIEQKTIMLFDVKTLVLDEADRMLDMGFAPQIKRILKVIPPQRQTMLFSATMPAEIVKIATQHMQLPVNVEIAPQGQTAENVTQELFIVSRGNKKELLLKLLRQYTGTVLMFTRSKYGAKGLARQLRTKGHRAAEIHSNRTQSQRKEALEGFKSGKYRILIATDIVARGIDVTNIELVINYDLPDDSENYVHRIGRTARAGQTGHAISFATPEQGKNVKQIEKLIRTEIEISQHPEMLIEKFEHFRPAPHRGSFNPRSNTKNWKFNPRT